jgi:hypothetical protein
MRLIGTAMMMATAAMLLGTAGCNPYGTYCEDKMYCLRGNELDEDACVIELEAEEDRADLWGCADRWDEYQACREEFTTCDANGDFTHYDRCDAERDSYHHCMP